MNIGLFGDSFCCDMYHPQSLQKGYDTYIKKLSKHYNARIVNLGVGGSSIWDCILKQFPPFLNNLPDVCIFVWTDSNRLYHPKLRNLTEGSLLNRTLKDVTFKTITHPHVMSAAKNYFKYLHDTEKSEREAEAALYHFDHKILSGVEKIIIHLWSFEKKYTWKYGKEITTPLSTYADFTRQGFDDWIPNHIEGEENNEKLFELIKDKIDKA